MVHCEIQKWEPNPDKPGYLRNAGNRTFGEVGQAIEEHLRSQRLAEWEWFQVGDVIIEQSEMPIPAYRSLMVAFHSGRNEGEIVKLIGITKEQAIFPIITIKHFGNVAESARIAQAMGEFLGDNL